MSRASSAPPPNDIPHSRVTTVTELQPGALPALPLDVEAIVADFAVLEPNADGQRLAFLDSAASAQKPRQVLDTMRDTYEHAYANVHRGVYRLANEATERYESVRETVRRFLNAPTAREIIFTRGTTEAINLVAYSWGLDNLGPGDIVVATQLEHHSNLVPWQQIAKRTGAELRYIPVDEHGVLALDDLDTLAAGGRVRFVAIGHVSNSLGSVNPVREVADWAHELGALVLVDGAQAAPHRAIDVEALGCDFYAFSGHKLLGPSGAGALWGKADLLRAMRPFQYGGEMIRKVTYEETTFNDLPWKFEAGTPAIVEVVGMGAAIEYLEALGIDTVHAHEQALTSYAYDVLEAVPGLTLYGPQRGAERGGILSFTLDCAHPHDIASMLDQRDVCIRAGNHCTQPLMRRLGVAATARASVYVYNGYDDVDRLVTGLHEVRELFGRRS